MASEEVVAGDVSEECAQVISGLVHEGFGFLLVYFWEEDFGLSAGCGVLPPFIPDCFQSMVYLMFEVGVGEWEVRFHSLLLHFGPFFGVCVCYFIADVADVRFYPAEGDVECFAHSVEVVSAVSDYF